MVRSVLVSSSLFLATCTGSEMGASAGTCFANTRLDCGYSGISSGKCESYGCCYKKVSKGLSCTLSQECAAVVDDGSAVDCGWTGISRDQCHNNGCCYSHGAGPHGYSCWHTRGATTNETSASLASQAPKVPNNDQATDALAASAGTCFANTRLDCGYSGISSSKCESYGCCYKKVSKGLSCTLSQECAAVVDDGSAVDCGWTGISRDQCHSNGCCYSHGAGPHGYSCWHTRGATMNQTMADVVV